MAKRVQAAVAAQGEEGEEVMDWEVDGEDGWRPGPGLEDWEMEVLVALSDEEESEDEGEGEGEGEEEDEKEEEDLEEGDAVLFFGPPDRKDGPVAGPGADAGAGGAGGEGGAAAGEQQTLAFRPASIAV